MSGSVDPERLEQARRISLRSGAPIDEVLVQLGVLPLDQLRVALGEAWGMPVADVARVDIDRDLVLEQPRARLLAERMVPLHRRPDGAVVVAAAGPVDAQRRARAESWFGSPIEWRHALSSDVRSVVLESFGENIADDAANELFRRNPSLSARVVFSRNQRIAAVIAVALLVAAIVLWPSWTIIGVISVIGLIFLAGTLFKFVVSMRGAQYDVVQRVDMPVIDDLDDDDLPVYTVLVPVFREENIVAQLVENLGDIDWPKDRLEVLVLIEEEDDLTRAALEKARPPSNFHVITVPRGAPQTKPRACNVGLLFATGEYLVIYDAEDAPDPDQLKKAYIAFQRSGSRTVCVQAALNYFNAEENVLTRMFTLEYSYWFDYMLAGLDGLDLPIPLGGTSNHFRTDALVELGGWDPYNVTEDADLGIRASALGYRVGVIDSTTMEEANTSIPNFIRQRSRWIKGYMQTTLVHARHPRRLIREIGLRRFASFALLIGGTPATFLSVLPLYLFTIATIAVPPEWIAQLFPPWMLWLCILNFTIGSSTMIYLSMMGPHKRGTFHLLMWSLLNPLYWILHSIAAWKGLWQLVTRPHYWEKTVHGLTTHAA